MNLFIEYMPHILICLTVIILLLVAIKIKFNEKKKHFYSSKEIELKLRAYERVILFIERIEPAGMINRMNFHGFSIEMIKSHLIKNIVLEYEYNLSQQIYVSNDLWNIIVEVKDQTINNISLICDTLDPNSNLQDFLDKLLKKNTIKKMHALVKKKIKSEVILLHS